MKWLDRITLIIFADIMLVIAVILCLLIFGWLDFGLVSNLCYKALTLEIPSKVVLVSCVIVLLLSLKVIFFSSSDREEKSKRGVLLENENGKLVISGETLQNLANSVAKGFESTEEVSTRVALDKENNLIIFVNLTVNSNAIIKELSTNLQETINRFRC